MDKRGPIVQPSAERKCGIDPLNNLDDPTPYIKQYAAYHTSRLRSDISLISKRLNLLILFGYSENFYTACCLGDACGMAYLQQPLPLPGVMPNLTKIR